MLHELDAAGAASSPELFYNILLFTTIQILFVFFLFFPHPHFLFYQCLFGVKPFVDKLTSAHECVEKGGGGVCVRCLDFCGLFSSQETGGRDGRVTAGPGTGDHTV